MAFHYRTLGIILKKIEKDEADQLFTIYTKDFGKINVLGRAIRKMTSKLRAGMENLYLSEIEFIQGKTHKTLTDVVLVDKFNNLRQDLKRLTLSFKTAKILDRLVSKEEPDKKIWKLINEVLNKLNDLKLKVNNLDLIYYYFLWNLFSFLGYQPEFSTCLFCGRKISPGFIYFNPKEGGLICPSCFKKSPPGSRKISSDTIKIIRIILRQDWYMLSRLKINLSHKKELQGTSKCFLLTILSSKF